MAGINIETVGVTISGNVTRKRDDTKDSTTFIMDKDQLRELYNNVGPVLAFFDQTESKVAASTGDVAGQDAPGLSVVAGGPEPATGGAASIGGVGHTKRPASSGD